VRLKGAYIIQCVGYKITESGELLELYANYFDNTKSGEDNSGIKVKGVIHWVDAQAGVPVTLMEYDKLFTDPTPISHEDKDFLEFVNPKSLVINDKAIAEPYILQAKPMDKFQAMRNAYYIVDKTSSKDKIVLNKTVSLKDSWSKKQKK